MEPHGGPPTRPGPLAQAAESQRSKVSSTCVTHVPGLFCYLSPRPLTLAKPLTSCSTLQRSMKLGDVVVIVGCKPGNPVAKGQATPRSGKLEHNGGTPYCGLPPDGHRAVWKMRWDWTVTTPSVTAAPDGP